MDRYGKVTLLRNRIHSIYGKEVGCLDCEYYKGQYSGSYSAAQESRLRAALREVGLDPEVVVEETRQGGRGPEYLFHGCYQVNDLLEVAARLMGPSA